MRTFTLTLPDGGIVSGRLSIPPDQPRASTHLPLLICLHGGGYDAEYFDIDTTHSVSSVTDALGIPVIAISRPGYGSSTPLPPVSNHDIDTFGQRQGRYLNSIVLPEVWKEYRLQTSATYVVLLTHSIGSMIGTIISGSYQGNEGYPLAGLITSGIGSEMVEEIRQHMIQICNRTNQHQTSLFEPTMKDDVMLQPSDRGLTHPIVYTYTQHLNKPVIIEELHDINVTWLNYWHKYTENVTVPVMNGIAEFDGLWVSTPNAVEQYKSAFTASPMVESRVVPRAPHCIEMSYQGKGWIARCCGFAMECGLTTGLSMDSANSGN